MENKKICIVGPAHPLRPGGMSTFNERLARAFVEEGYEVKILTFKLQYPNFLFPGKTQWSKEPKPKDIDIDVSMNSINPFNWFRVGNKYKKKNFDLVIFRYWMPFMAPCFGTIARRIASNGKSKCIAITDNVIPHEKRKGDTLLTRYFVNSMVGFVSMSKSVLEDLKKFDVTKPKKYIPHPLYDSFGPSVKKNVAKLKLNLNETVRYVLFFGFIRDYKGLDLLLESFSKADFNGENVKLLIAGEFYSNEEKYLQQIDDLGIGENVILRTDFIPNHEVPLYFCAADLVAQTYKTATQSGVTQIAYNYKIPMLVTSVGGLAELVPHKKVGLVAEPNVASITNNLNEFFKEENSSTYIANLEEERKRFSWSSLVKQLVELV